MKYNILRAISLALMVLLASLATVIAADGVDDQGNPNDPAINDNANACFEGGSMEDKCETEWEWDCGWHLIRLEEGLISEALFPTWCNSLIEEAPSEFPGCQIVNMQEIFEDGEWVVLTYYYDFGNSLTLSTPFNVYLDSDCAEVFTVAGGDAFAIIVFAANDEIAYELCAPYFDETFFVSPERAPLNPFVTACYVESARVS